MAAAPESVSAEPAVFGFQGMLSAGQPRIIAKAILPGFTISHTASEVHLQFTVTDDRDNLLRTLSGSDVRILDNRVAVPQLRKFSHLDDLPLQVGILLDASDSVQRVAASERQAIRYFLQQVLRPQTDRAALMAFSNGVRLWQPSTGDRNALGEAVAKVPQVGFATYFYDGVYRACVDQFPISAESGYAQRVLLLITDGDDTGSLHSLSDAISEAQRREVQIFALSIHPPRLIADGDKTLRHLAEATGGQFYIAASERDFPGIFGAMEQQMRTQYSVSFQPATQSPGPHMVSIELTGGGKLHVRARQAYFYDVP
jgi:Ca-activated chloride channel homolog